MRYLLVILFLFAGCATPLKATWYSTSSMMKEGSWQRWGGLTANGEKFDEASFTCATWLYPFGTKLKVTNLENGKSVIVRVNNRINRKFAKKRIDLTKIAFKQIAPPSKGIVPVKVERVRK